MNVSKTNFKPITDAFQEIVKILRDDRRVNDLEVNSMWALMNNALATVEEPNKGQVIDG